jgi:hemin uptake protein HemP
MEYPVDSSGYCGDVDARRNGWRHGRDPRSRHCHDQAPHVRSEWLSPADARRSLETRSAALADWLQARGGAVRIISSESLLRTHGADGSRLAIPLARFERVLEVQLPEGIEMAHTQRALLGPDGSVVIASARGTRHGQPPRPGSTALDF